MTTRQSAVSGVNLSADGSHCCELCSINRKSGWPLRKASSRQVQEVLGKAMAFAASCGRAYKKASDRSRRLLDQAVFERLDIPRWHVAEITFHAPFHLLFSEQKFEYGRQVEKAGDYSNHPDVHKRVEAVFEMATLAVD